MFGTAHDSAASAPAEPKPAQPVSVLGKQTQSFFAGYGGKVSAASNPRPVQPARQARNVPQQPASRSARLVQLSSQPFRRFTGKDSPMANLLLSVMGAFAEFERAMIGERQSEGIVLAKQRGAYRGRKKALVDNQVVELRCRARAGEQKATLTRDFGISRETLYQYLKVEPTA